MASPYYSPPPDGSSPYPPPHGSSPYPPPVYSGVSPNAPPGYYSPTDHAYSASAPPLTSPAHAGSSVSLQAGSSHSSPQLPSSSSTNHLDTSQSLIFEFSMPSCRSLKPEAFEAVSHILNQQNFFLFHFTGVLTAYNVLELLGWLQSHEECCNWIPKPRDRLYSHNWTADSVIECFIDPSVDSAHGYLLICYPYQGQIAIHVAVFNARAKFLTNALSHDFVFRTKYFKGEKFKTAGGAALGAAGGLAVDAAFGFATLGAGAAIGGAVGAIAMKSSIKKAKKNAFHGDELVDQDARDHLAFILGPEIYDRLQDKFNLSSLFECYLLNYIRQGIATEINLDKLRICSLRDVGFLPESLLTRLDPSYQAFYRWKPDREMVWKTAMTNDWKQHSNGAHPCQWFGTVFRPSESKGEKNQFFALLKDGVLLVWDHSEQFYKSWDNFPKATWSVKLFDQDDNAITLKPPRRKQKKMLIDIEGPRGEGHHRKVTITLGFKDRGEGNICLTALKEACGKKKKGK